MVQKLADVTEMEGQCRLRRLFAAGGKSRVEGEYVGRLWERKEKTQNEAARGDTS